MINQLGIIENELKQIQAEIPKKQNTLKDVSRFSLFTNLSHPSLGIYKRACITYRFQK